MRADALEPGNIGRHGAIYFSATERPASGCAHSAPHWSSANA